MIRLAFAALGAVALGIAGAIGWLLYGSDLDDLIIDFD